MAWWSFLVLVCVVLVVSQKNHFVFGEPQVPCYFVFGDSLSDVGNNNDLLTTAKSNYAPYGIDYPEGPTGRFGNGRILVDIIAELLGFEKSPPPYAYTRGVDILKGVNYASGGAGILNETGRHMGDEIPMDEQLQNHKKIVTKIVKQFGNDKSLAANYLAKCIYTVTIGSNDYLNNYFLPQFYPTSREYTPDQFATLLFQRYSQQLQQLYDQGARKVGVFGLGLLGCTILVKEWYGIEGDLSCAENVTYAVSLFNERLESLVYNDDLVGAKFTYINFAGIGLTGFSALTGFTVLSTSCCTVRATDGACIPNENPCDNRGDYVFWDAVHTTEAANAIYATRAYSALLPTDAYPYDLQYLATLDSSIESFQDQLKASLSSD
ncbi:GDSL esterase/lipase At4g18970-like [Tripterygium wilfordii]|nr:GDSL esterase/lipase At4g18970-like [Tripterygium wilfordii]